MQKLIAPTDQEHQNQCLLEKLCHQNHILTAFRGRIRVSLTSLPCNAWFCTWPNIWGPSSFQHTQWIQVFIWPWRCFALITDVASETLGGQMPVTQLGSNRKASNVVCQIWAFLVPGPHHYHQSHRAMERGQVCRLRSDLPIYPSQGEGF